MSKNNETTKRLAVYLAVTFMITYVIEIGVIYPLWKQGGAQQNMIILLEAAVMLIPSLGVVLTRLFTKEGFQNVWIRPKCFKKTWKYYLIGWFAPALLTMAGTVVYFLVFPEKYDSQLNLLAELLAQSGAGAVSQEQLKIIVIAQFIQAALLGPALNFVFAFGEEWGWRGYLLPKMKEKLPMLPMLLVNGIIWGLWHAPLTCIGHNYGVGYPGYPVTGILMMCGFCVVMGVLFTWVTLKSESCIPAALAHGGLNGIASIGVYLSTDGGNPFVGPAATGVIGGVGFIAAAVILAVLLMREEKTVSKNRVTETEEKRSR